MLLVLSSSPLLLDRRAVPLSLVFVVAVVLEGGHQCHPPHACLQGSVWNVMARYCWMRRDGKCLPPSSFFTTLVFGMSCVRLAWDVASQQEVNSILPLTFIVIAVLMGNRCQRHLPHPCPLLFFCNAGLMWSLIPLTHAFGVPHGLAITH